MHRIIKRALVTAAVLGPLSLGLSATASASARPAITPACSHGPLAGSCGTQVSASSPALGLAAVKAAQNQQVTGKSDLTTSATDWYWFTGPSGQKGAEFAPSGKESGYCLAQTSVGSAVVLRHCNGSTWQQWNFNNADNGTWANLATSQVLAVTKQAQPVLAVTLAGAAPTPYEQFTFYTQLIPA